MIIHSPEISGSLTLVGGAVIKDPVFSGSVSSVGDTGDSVYSGSFSGSFQGDGSSLTGVQASALNIDLFDSEIIVGNDEILFSDTDDSGNEKRGTFQSGLDSIGVVSGSDQVLGGTGILSSSTEDFSTFSSSVATDFSNLSSDFDELTNNPFTQSASSVTITKDLLPNDSEIDLGSVSQPFRDLYLSSASLYVNGEQVISSTDEDLTITTGEGQSLKLRETANDTITLETANGDITLQSTGTGNIELDSPIQIGAGNQILSSDGNPIEIGEDISVTGNITVTGTVDGLDLQAFSGSVATDFAALSTDYNDLQNVPAGIVSGSDQLTGSLVDIASEQTISGTKTFNDIVVNGTGSFAVIESVSGTAKIIGDAFIILNNNTPSERYAGIKVQDSGSAGVTASLQFDGEENDWFYQYSDDGGVTVDHGVVLFGPEYSSIGVPTYPTNNTIQKGNGGHHLLDSNITDDGSIVSVTGDFTVSGNITGSSDAQFAKVGVGGTSDATYELKVTGDIGATGDIVAYISSDERLKDNIQIIEDPIGKVEQLRGVTWEWNDEASDAAKDSPNVGVIAQDVENVLPQLVHDRENGYKGVDYSKLAGLLIEAVKEQASQIRELEDRLESLEG